MNTAAPGSLKTLNNSGHKLNINYKVLGYVNAYGGANAYADENLTNLLAGYTNKPMFGYNLNQSLGKQSDSNVKLTVSDPEKLINNPKEFPDNNFALSPQKAYDGWFNSKYQNSVEPYDLTSYYSASTANNNGNYLVSISWPGQDFVGQVQSQNLLGEKQKLINHLTTIGVSVSVVLLAFVIACALLLIVLVTNLFVSQYDRFMTLMKTEGYTKRQIMAYTINVFTPFAFISWGVGAFIGWLFINGVHSYAFSLGLAIPFGVMWWVYLSSFFIVILMYSLVFYFAYSRLKKSGVDSLRMASDE